MKSCGKSLPLAVLLGIASLHFASSACRAEEQVVREQREVHVNGIPETWRLVWDGKPGIVCGPDEVYMAITCPCSGWGYGEYGKLYLTRNRDGREIERMDLRPLFGQFDYPDADKLKGFAYLPRWPMKLMSDFDRENIGDPNLVADIKRRPAPAIMKFADYDRSGDGTQFLLQVGVLPCGKRQFAAIGLTKNNPHLHALTTVAHPEQPLMIPLSAWQALLNSEGPTVVPKWECGDHGADDRGELVVWARTGAIKVKEQRYSCPGKGDSEKLIEQKEE